ncbi:retrovirus-related Pol polyprotein from transposon 412 [Trichonephila clavipes]|nr:retrovirus-related Pol polyprotein from transposon 412 [Trichonephila clavipes]
MKGETSILQFARDSVKDLPSTKPGQQLSILSLTAWSAVHETIGYSPSQMLFGRDLRQPTDIVFSRLPGAPLAPEKYIEKLQARMEELHHLARERIAMVSEKMKTRYDARATGHYFTKATKCGYGIRNVAKVSLRSSRPTSKNLGGRTGKILRPSSVALKSKNQDINRLQLAVKLPWAIFFESVDILS